MPQTAATLEQRIAVLEKLIASEPEIAFQLMDKLLHRGSDAASLAKKPDWRDDDAGTAARPSGAEVYGVLAAAADRMLAMANGNADRLVRLLDKLTLLDPPRVDQADAMVAAFTAPEAQDSERELIRNELRSQLHWHLSYGKNHPETDLSPEQISRWRELYDALSPVDPVICHRWLFQNGWVDLPMEAGEDYRQEDQRREEWRLSALKDVYQDLGLEGVLRLADLSGDAFVLGRCLLDVVSERSALADWILDLDTDFSLGLPRTSMICGILRCLPQEETAPFLGRVVQLGRERDWAPERLAAFLRLAQDERLTWSLAEECGGESIPRTGRSSVPRFGIPMR